MYYRDEWAGWIEVRVIQSCLILCDPVDCSPPGSSVHGILQERILEWVVIPFSRGSSWLKDQTWVSCTASRFFTIWTTRKAEIRAKVEKSQNGGLFYKFPSLCILSCSHRGLGFSLLCFWEPQILNPFFMSSQSLLKNFYLVSCFWKFRRLLIFFEIVEDSFGK